MLTRRVADVELRAKRVSGERDRVDVEALVQLQPEHEAVVRLEHEP